MKSLLATKIEFTDNGRNLASEVISKLPTPMDVDFFIEQLQEEFDGIRSINHQMMTAADVIRVADKHNFEI